MCSIVTFFDKLRGMSSSTEHPACQVDELKVNEKKVVRINDVGIVIYREAEDQFRAFGNKCSHYGAPLINGVIYNGHVSCPWHAACFSIRTGDIEDFPGCDSIPAFETIIKDGTVYVKAEENQIIAKRSKPLTPRNILSRETIVIVGGGPAGFQCAETLRQEGFSGRVALVSSEDASPYDRTKLSKSLSSTIDSILLRKEDYYKKAGIELILQTQCTKLDTLSQMIYLNNGSNLYYDKIFLATGSSPRKYDSSLENIKNVYYLRTYRNANAINEAVKDKNVVLIGSSFIVLEIASSISGKCKSVSIISRSSVPFAASLGTKIGQTVKKLCESKNVKFYVAPKVNFSFENDLLKKIQMESVELEVDTCVVGIGSEPNSAFLRDSGIKLMKGFVEVNDKLESSVANVYAGGDLVIYPHPLLGRGPVNIAHWQTAQAHGRIAALTMMNKPITFQSVPFFWSAVFGKGIRFAGTVQDPENCIIDGNLDELSFVAYYFNSQSQVIGVATMSRDPMASAFAAWIRDGKTLTKEDIENRGSAWFEENFY